MSAPTPPKLMHQGGYKVVGIAEVAAACTTKMALILNKLVEFRQKKERCTASRRGK